MITKSEPSFSDMMEEIRQAGIGKDQLSICITRLRQIIDAQREQEISRIAAERRQMILERGLNSHLQNIMEPDP